MTFANKAPTGGMTSKVNGQFYAGGEFMPITGEYCGVGRNRVPVSAIKEINAKLDNAEIVWNEKANQFQLLRLVTFRDGTVTKQVQFSASNIKTLTKLA